MPHKLGMENTMGKSTVSENFLFMEHVSNERKVAQFFLELKITQIFLPYTVLNLETIK